MPWSRSTGILRARINFHIIPNISSADRFKMCQFQSHQFWIKPGTESRQRRDEVDRGRIGLPYPQCECGALPTKLTAHI
jgi:hypothetical protein